MRANKVVLDGDATQCVEAVLQTPDRSAAPATHEETAAASEARRQKRLAALSRSCGIWAGEPDTPRDGVIYQQKLRAEGP